MIILNGIKFLDVLGIEFQFKIKESDLYKTILGGFLTIILVMVFLVSIWVFGRDIIEKQNPLFIQREVILDKIPIIKINRDNMFFAIRLVDEIGGFVNDPRYLEPIFRYQHYVQKPVTLELELEEESLIRMKKCDDSIVDNNTLIKEGLNTYYCHEYKNISLGGGWDEEEVGVISYQIRKCSTQTEELYGIKCANDSEIFDKYRNVFWVETKNLNWIINPSNLTHPLIPQYVWSSQALALDVQKRKDFYYSTSELFTDMGLITTEYDIKSFNQFQKTELDFRNVESDSAIYSIDILISNVRSESVRSYIKAQNVAATIGGFLNLIFYFFRMIYLPYVENHMQYFFYEELLDLKIESEDSKILFLNDKLNEQDSMKDEKNNQISTIIPFKPMTNSITNIKEDNSFLPGNLAIGVSTDFKMIDISENDANRNSAGMIEMTIVESKDNNGTDKKKKYFDKRLKTLSEHTRKTRENLKYDKWKLFKFRNCMCKNEKNLNKRKQDKNQIFYLAEYDISKRLDALSLLKNVDHFKVLKQIVLNQDQGFMLDNRGKKTITNIKLLNKGDFTKVVQDKNKMKELHLASYLTEKKENNSIDDVDLVLYELLDREIRSKLDEAGIKL